MTFREKENKMRNSIKDLKRKGYQYKLFWNGAGMSQTRFYNWINSKVSLKETECICLMSLLKDDFNIII